jgi:hypothetical protein
VAEHSRSTTGSKAKLGSSSNVITRDPSESGKMKVEAVPTKASKTNNAKGLTCSPGKIGTTFNGNRSNEASEINPADNPPQSQSLHSFSSNASHATSAKIVNKKSMDVTIVNEAKWRTAAARCITPETKKMYTKSKVVAYPISDDDGSSCNESYRIFRNTREVMAAKIDTNERMVSTEHSTHQVSAERLSSADAPPCVPKEGTTTTLLSIWKEKEQRNGYPHRKALL